MDRDRPVTPSPGRLPDPPGSSPRARRLARRALAPVERFLAIEVASGIVLLLAAIVALIWANSRWAPAYHALWHAPIGLRFGGWSYESDLHFWINDAVMTIFFFVVGLEIRREMHRGELQQPRRALVPVVAAIGGMVVPALLFLLFNHGRATAGGWGIPMATDIAFAVGIFAALGRRVSHAARVLLLTLAVIDDIGAIVVIAFFYSGSIAPEGFAVVAAGLGATVAMQKLGIRSPWAYMAPGSVVWIGAYLAGVHPTLAGVVLGLMTPVRPWYEVATFSEHVEHSLRAVREESAAGTRVTHIEQIDRASREVLSPLERLEHALHGWVAFGVMPLFALANAGVPLGGAVLDGDGLALFAGIALGLLLGKPTGVVASSWLAARVGAVTMPAGMGGRQLLLVGTAAGIGFTMALFMAQLAFPDGPLLETAKLAIITASALSAVLGAALGIAAPPGERRIAPRTERGPRC